MNTRCKIVCLVLLLSSNTSWSQQTNLSTIASLRATPRSQATSHPLVRVRGVVSLVGEGLVTPPESSPSSFCLEDDTAGIWVSISRALREDVWQTPAEVFKDLHEGLEIELEGQLDPGAYAPIILPSSLRILGERELAVAQRKSVQSLMRGQIDIDRGVVGGVVQSIAEENSNRWLLTIESGLGKFLARLPKSDQFTPEKMLDAEVELTGLIAASRNWRAEFVCPRVIVSHENHVVVLKAPSADPFACEKISLCELDGYKIGGRPLHRRTIEGTVTYIEPGRVLYLQDGSCAVRVEMTKNEELQVGDRIEAVGFIDNSFTVAGLGGAVVRKLSHGNPPDPLPISMSKIEEQIDLSRRRQTSSNSGYDGMLVTMDGKLLGVQPASIFGGQTRLELNCDGAITTAIVCDSLDNLRVGSQLRVTGIADVHYTKILQTANFLKPVRIDLLVRSSSDLQVLTSPSWWTPSRLNWLLAVLGTTAVAIFAWAVTLNRTVAIQTRKLAKEMKRRRDAVVEFQATLRERTRLAANLHDTLLQSMTGIAYQIEACESESLPEAERLENHLATAKRMIQRSQEDLRSAVWALRALPLNESTFDESIRTVAKQISSGSGVEINVEAASNLPALADFLAGNLLLIVQEAIHNAIKHAKPKRIVVSLASLHPGRAIALTIQDDGCGFEVGKQPTSSSGHFGLEGMRERAERLSGTLTVQSQPGLGTRICAQVPVLDFDSYLT